MTTPQPPARTLAVLTLSPPSDSTPSSPSVPVTTITKPFPAPDDWQTIKAALIIAHPSHGALAASLAAAEARLEKDAQAAHAQREKALKELHRVTEERAMGRKLWEKMLEKLEGEEGSEAKAVFRARVGREANRAEGEGDGEAVGDEEEGERMEE